MTQIRTPIIDKSMITKRAKRHANMAICSSTLSTSSKSPVEIKSGSESRPVTCQTFRFFKMFVVNQRSLEQDSSFLCPDRKTQNRQGNTSEISKHIRDVNATSRRHALDDLKNDRHREREV